MDDVTGHYLIMEIGWSQRNRIHGILIHVDVIDGKIHVEHDGMSAGIVNMLLDKGVPKTDIVLGWHAPSLRHYTPYALA